MSGWVVVGECDTGCGWVNVNVVRKGEEERM